VVVRIVTREYDQQFGFKILVGEYSSKILNFENISGSYFLKHFLKRVTRDDQTISSIDNMYGN
jgi:hypothetical protein